MSAWRILGAIVAVVALAVVVAGVLMWQRLIPIPGPLLTLLVGAKEPEYSARYYPPDTIAYGWITLIPGEGQINDMQEIWGRLNEYPGFEKFVEETKHDFLTETGIDFDVDVRPWIGPEISGGVIDFDAESETVTAAATIGVRDVDAAESFLDKWLVYMEDETDADFSTGSRRGVAIWVDEAVHQAYAVTDDWLVYATDEGTLISMLDRMDGYDDESLADTEKFVEARAALPERRFHSGYLDYQEALKRIDDALPAIGPVVPGVIGPTTFAKRAPHWVAISGRWVERGVVVEMVSPTVSELGLNVPDLGDPAAILPHDAFGFMAASFDPNVDNWRKALAAYDLRDVLPDPGMIGQINHSLRGMTPEGRPALADDATLSDALDLSFTLAKQFTGIDLERDFFGHLGGEMIVAVREFDFDDISADPTRNPIHATAMLSHTQDGAEPLADTMRDVGGLLTNHVGLSPERISVGADNDAAVFDLSQFEPLVGSPIGYRPGYVLHDGYLTIGSTENVLATTVELQNGDGHNLASVAEFQRAMTHLPADRQFLGYVAIDHIVNQLEADDFGMDADDFRVIDETLGVVAFSSDIATVNSRTTVVLTLFP